MSSVDLKEKRRAYVALIEMRRRRRAAALPAARIRVEVNGDLYQELDASGFPAAVALPVDVEHLALKDENDLVRFFAVLEPETRLTDWPADDGRLLVTLAPAEQSGWALTIAAAEAAAMPVRLAAQDCGVVAHVDAAGGEGRFPMDFENHEDYPRVAPDGVFSMAAVCPLGLAGREVEVGLCRAAPLTERIGADGILIVVANAPAGVPRRELDPVEELAVWLKDK